MENEISILFEKEINDHRRCECYLEALLKYLFEVYKLHQNKLAIEYLRNIVAKRIKYPNCCETYKEWRKADEQNIEFAEPTFFDLSDLIDFCSDIKNAKIVRAIFIVPEPVIFYLVKYKTERLEYIARKCVLQFNLSNLEIQSFLNSLKIAYPHFYSHKDVRKLVGSYIYNPENIKKLIWESTKIVRLAKCNSLRRFT